MLSLLYNTPPDKQRIIMNADKLIHAVQKRPELWDPKHIGHNNRMLVNKLWQEVAEEVGTDKILAKSRWRGLRDYYRQEVRKQIAYNSDPNTTTEYHSSWALFDLMYFVKDTILTRRTRDFSIIGNAVPNGLDVKMEQEESFVDDPINVCIPKLETQYDLPDYMSEINNQETSSPEIQDDKMMGKRRMDWSENEVKKRKLEEENDNDDLQFFKSLLPDLIDLPRAKKSFIRLKIQEIVHKVVHNNEGLENGRDFTNNENQNHNIKQNDDKNESVLNNEKNQNLPNGINEHIDQTFQNNLQEQNYQNINNIENQNFGTSTD